MKELLLCALKRHGKPATAGDLTDAAIALAQSAGWPRRSWSTLTVQTAAALLKGMEKRAEIERAGTRTENGRAIPLWQPNTDRAGEVWGPEKISYDEFAVLPPTPEPVGDDHPLHGKNNRQKFVLFDVMSTALEIYGRQAREVADLVHKHQRELCDLASRAKRDLIAVGLEDGL